MIRKCADGRPPMALAAALAIAGTVALAAAPLGDGARQPAPDDVRTGKAEISAELIEAVDLGLEALAARQLPDGAWDGQYFGKNVAVTSLACLAFMADGHLPGRGRYGDAVDRGLTFVLECVTESGLIASDQASGPMYGHGFAALFLGEIYGMTRGGGDTVRARELHEAIVKSTRLIEQVQNDEGGWRYHPAPRDADVSVTICQVMALRSARNAGIEVSRATIERAIDYIRECQNPDGGWRYQARPGESRWPRSAAGIATLFYAGVYEDEAIDRGIEYLRTTAMPNTGRADRRHLWYGHYYAVQAMFLAGGSAWEEWWPACRDEILDMQRPDGVWRDPSVGESYGTAMALIVLQMPKRYLPIYQR